MARTRRTPDPEVKATSTCVYALEPLDADQRDRVVTYLSKRFGPASNFMVLLLEEVTELKQKLRAAQSTEEKGG